MKFEKIDEGIWIDKQYMEKNSIKYLFLRENYGLLKSNFFGPT